jgi:DNA replication protein DnaC
MTETILTPPQLQSLEERARRLGLLGLLAHWQEVSEAPWIETVIHYEEEERSRKSLQRRITNAKIGPFKPMADFDWQWPEEIDREIVEDLFNLEFLKEAGNVVLVGANGVGKTMIAQNLAYQAVLRGHTARVITASELLNDLAAQEAGSALTRRLRHYLRPQLLVIDEVGYLSSSARHADLLFEVINRRYQHRSIVLTTNKAFKEWNEVFPSSGCIVTLVDRLVHKAEIINIVAKSYRVKEAQERAKARSKARAMKTKGKKTRTPGRPSHA